ncbi:ADP-ribosylglycohydrolase family protein [Ornithinimicrobium sp. F0845]|uniref:ADP-ribosylglycohydrolase family protein n=1 Tax=Ornithinimicrobium sp. F0845 TaxID=2926412 RepID=UPI001FF24E2F|nr:ADP-ribosylglycohydrolase family protein [Ornithinimicrobium sp. F0845]MCK0112486.1 ADP-ribosylglycohydrolase family protein [Ornithinimicrobium sp. F0845]
MTRLSTAQHDRAAGVLLTQAVGDALGVPYEFAAPPANEPQMLGGGLGPFAPGEWSDDTQMAVCIAQVAAAGIARDSSEGLDQVAEQFLTWWDSRPADVGVQTASVLREVRRGAGAEAVSLAERMTSVARALHERTGRTAGNGALMRTGTVGLTRLEDREATTSAARAVAELTHADPLAGDSCVLWCEAIRVAVLEGRLDLTGGLDLLPGERRDQWASWIDEAETKAPGTFRNNGFTVVALQAAWSAIVHSGRAVSGPDHVGAALTAAIQIGHDTDTVAAIAGALLGARYGASALPFRWTRLVHGWPGLRAQDLVALALRTAKQGTVGRGTWPRAKTMVTGRDRSLAAPHPFDDKVLLGTMTDLTRVAELGVDAVVSLCRLGSDDFAPAGVAPSDHGVFWIVDHDDPSRNQHLDHVLTQAATAVRDLRSEGRTVLLHCVAAQHRTPAVALRYAQLLGHDGPQVEDQIAAAVDFDPAGHLWDTARQHAAGDPTTAAG